MPYRSLRLLNGIGVPGVLVARLIGVTVASRALVT